MRRHMPHRLGLSVVVLVGVLLMGTVPRAVGQLGGLGTGAVGGVYIDPQGMLHETSALGEAARLQLLRDAAANAAVPRDVAVRSPLRKVSLRRLEEAVRQRHAAGETLPAEMRYLAGLTAVQSVFFYPEAGDVVLAGPAEGWRLLPTGDVVGLTSGRPVLHLDDLVVTLRYAFRPRADAFIGCSIDPTAEGLKNYNRVVGQMGPVNRAQIPQLLAAMQQSIGPFAVTVYGVGAGTPFALKLVAADYRLKRIAMAHDPSPIPELPSYLDLAVQRYVPVAQQPMHRWWFVAEYDAIHHTPDGLAFEFSGQGVRLATEQARLGLASEKGNKKDTKKKKAPKASPAAEQFARLFTKHYEKIAARQPIFAELQNLIGLAVATELIAEKHDRRDGGEHWRPTHFLDESACPVARVNVPAHTPPLVNARFVGGGHWLTTLSGGVEIIPRKLMAAEDQTAAERPQLSETRRTSVLPDEATRWWWD